MMLASSLARWRGLGAAAASPAGRGAGSGGVLELVRLPAARVLLRHCAECAGCARLPVKPEVLCKKPNSRLLVSA